MAYSKVTAAPVTGTVVWALLEGETALSKDDEKIHSILKIAWQRSFLTKEWD